MNVSTVLVDAFSRIRGVVSEVVDGLTSEQLSCRVDSGSNSIGWLIWHLTRIQDDHVADLAAVSQVWSSDGWSTRFGLPFRESATGYGHSGDEVAAVRVTGELLTGYHDAVYERTVQYLLKLTETDLHRVVDRSWNPPVTLGVRLVSVIADDLQHAGQAAFIRGIIQH